jgi:hypothetical protein
MPEKVSHVDPTAPPPSAIQTRKPRISFNVADVPPTQFLYLQDNDFISLNILSNAGATPSVTAKYRYLTPDNEVKEGSAVTGSGSFFQFIIGEGWLLSLALSTNASDSTIWTYVQVLLERQSLTVHGTNTDYEVIWEGYVPQRIAEGWPDTPSKQISDGAGTLRSITGTTPAAGAEINEVVPTFRRWLLLALKASLTTGVAVANRFPGVRITDGALTSYLIHVSIAQAASLTQGFNFAPGQPFFNDTTGNFLIPLPQPIWLKAGFQLKTDTVALQAADQWTAPQYLVMEWGQWDV